MLSLAFSFRCSPSLGVAGAALQAQLSHDRASCSARSWYAAHARSHDWRVAASIASVCRFANRGRAASVFRAQQQILRLAGCHQHPVRSRHITHARKVGRDRHAARRHPLQQREPERLLAVRGGKDADVVRAVGVDQRLLVEISGHPDVVGAAVDQPPAQGSLGTPAHNREREARLVGDSASIATAAPLYGRSWPTNSTRSGRVPSYPLGLAG